MPSPAEDLIASARRNVSSAQGAGASAREIAAANEKESYSLLEAVALNAGADITLATEAWKATNAVEEAKGRARAAAGGEEKMLALISETVAGGEKVKGFAKEVERKNNRSVFDLVSDPVGTVTDLFTRKSSIEKLKGAIATTTATANAASQRHAVLQHGFKEAEDAKNTATAATLQADTDKIRAKQLQSDANIRIQGRVYNLDGVKTALQMSVQETQSYSQIFGTESAVEQQKMQRAQLVLSQANHALSVERHKLDLKLAKERAEAKGEAADEMSVVGSALANGMAAAGLKAPEGAGMRLAVREALTDKNSPFFQYYAIGLRNQAIGQNSTMVGATPAESISTLSRKDIVMAVPDAVQPTLAILRDAEAQLKGVDRKTNPGAWNKAYDDKIKEIVSAESGNISSSSSFDVGKALPGYIQNSPALLALPLTKKLFAPMMATNQSIADPVVTLKLGIAEMHKGNLTSDELIGGFNAIYRQSAIVQAQAMRLHDFGIITPYGAGAEYRVKLGYGDRVNLTDNTELSRWLAKTLATRNSMKTGTLLNLYQKGVK